MLKSFDLSPYEGQTVLLSFRYMTDWAVENPGWWIDDIAINGILIENADDVNSFNAPSAPETDFYVTMISKLETDTGIEYFDILFLDLDDITESAAPIDMNAFAPGDQSVYVIVSPTLGLADYTIKMTRE